MKSKTGKAKYKCDEKLKLYDHAGFYERNLERAKKLYCPKGIKAKTSTIKSIYATKPKKNMQIIIKNYNEDIKKLKKENKLEPVYTAEVPKYTDEELAQKINNVKSILDPTDDVDDYEEIDFQKIMENIPKGNQR